MKTIPTTLLVAAAVALAAPAAAQDDAPADTAAAETAPAADMAAEDEAPAAETPAPPTHDWEFALSPTGRAAGAGGTVKVTDGEGASTFLVETTGLPVVDSLDSEERDVNAYTVWVVPSKDRVPESTLAGVLTIDPETGDGTLEAESDLDTFGIIVTATADGAPERIGGVPVLTGIPVNAVVAPADAPAADGGAPPNESPAPGDQPADQEPDVEPEPESGSTR